MAVNLPHPELVSQNYSEQNTFNVLESSYGDGYTQQAINGINYVNTAISVNWENINATEANSIEQDLVTSLASHVVFNDKTYFLTGYSVTNHKGLLRSVSATLKRIYI